MLEQYGMDELVEGQDFFVEQKAEKGYDVITRRDTQHTEYFFKNPEGKLLGYIKVYIEVEGEDRAAYIIDTTSASGYAHFSKEMKDLYDSKGYSSSAAISGFGKVAFAYILADIKKNHPKVRVIPITADAKNEDAVWGLIERVKDTTMGLVSRLT